MSIQLTKEDNQILQAVFANPSVIKYLDGLLQNTEKDLARGVPPSYDHPALIKYHVLQASLKGQIQLIEQLLRIGEAQVKQPT